MVRAGHLDGPLPLACISSVKYKGDLRLQLGGGGTWWLEVGSRKFGKNKGVKLLHGGRVPYYEH